MKTRSLQVGFLVLLGATSAQLAWWMIDEVAYTREVLQRQRAAYEAEIEPARMLMREGRSWAEVERVYPTLTISPDSSTISVKPSVLAELDQHRFHRLNRYGWEGAFFLAVLIASMAVVYRSLREEAELRRRQEQFLAAISHEMKSPLASLRLSVETLALRDVAPHQRGELVRRMIGDLDRLQRMITNTLATARLSAPEARSVPVRLDLATEVADAMGELQDYAGDREVSLQMEVPAELAVRADPDGMRTTLRNLLHNAIKASPTGGVVRVRATIADDQARLEVEDQGIGFPPDEADRLFEKFYRLEGDENGRMQGTGLGLYLVRRHVELDGGTVAAVSGGPGHGAVFTVTWPLAVEAA